MDKEKTLYIVRGTGLSLDGTIVEIKEERGDHYVVSPPNSKITTRDWILVHKKCLQPFVTNSKIEYKIVVTKKTLDTGNIVKLPQEITISIDGYRDVSLDSIAEFIKTNLVPILRME